MLTPEYIIQRIKLPATWEIIRDGADKNINGKIQKIYIVLSTPDDVITILAYLNCKADECSIEVGWKLKRSIELHGHKVILTEHPGGGRSQYIWYCAQSNATFMINFSKDLAGVWKILRKIKCH
jgi:hypothetical protein